MPNDPIPIPSPGAISRVLCWLLSIFIICIALCFLKRIFWSSVSSYIFPSHDFTIFLTSSHTEKHRLSTTDQFFFLRKGVEPTSKLLDNVRLVLIRQFINQCNYAAIKSNKIPNDQSLKKEQTEICNTIKELEELSLDHLSSKQRDLKGI